MTVDDATTRLKTLIEQKIILQLTPEHQSQNVLFITQKTIDWFNALMAALYQKEVSKKQVLHIINIKKVLEMLPVLFQEIKEKPNEFFGICKASEILTDPTKVLEISEAGLLFLAIDNTLIGIQINAFLGAELVGLQTILKRIIHWVTSMKAWDYLNSYKRK